MALVAAAAVLAACPASHPAGRWDCGGNPCDDGDACNGVETCDAEVGCVAGTFVDCDDHDPCTVDSCAAGSCGHAQRDLDADGYPDPCAGGDDCALQDPAVHPDAPEGCNGRDDDCDLEVDEGLEVGLLESATYQDRYQTPTLLLPDGTQVGADARGLWTATDVGVTRIPLVEGEPEVAGAGAPILPDATPVGLAQGGGALLAALWGPIVPVGPGQPFAFRLWDDVGVVEIDDAGAVVSFREIDPCGSDRCLPTSLGIAQIGEASVLAFGAMPEGKPAVLVAGLEDGAEPPSSVARTRLPLQRLALVGGREGGLVFWTEGWPREAAVLRVATLDAAGHATGLVLDLQDGIDAGVSACPSASGAAVAVRSEGIVRLLHVDSTLEATELASWSDPSLAHPAVRCSPSGIWVLAGGRLRRLDARGQATFDEPTGLDGDRFVEAAGVVVAGHRGSDTLLELRRYGCAP